MSDHGSTHHYVKRFALVRRGGVAESGKPFTRLAFIDRLTRDGEALRGKMLNLGGRDHGSAATKNVTIEVETIEADWARLPTPAEVRRAKSEVPLVDPAELA